MDTENDDFKTEINTIKSENEKFKAEIDHVKLENLKLNEETKMLKSEIDILKMYNEELNTKISRELSNGASFVAIAGSERRYEDEETVRFDNVIENVGNHYDPSNGEYTCPTNGYYLFSASIMAVPDYEMRCSIYVDNLRTVRLLPHKDWDQTSATAVVSCAAGQKVTVRSTDNDQYARASECSFTGTLLSVTGVEI